MTRYKASSYFVIQSKLNEAGWHDNFCGLGLCEKLCAKRDLRHLPRKFLDYFQWEVQWEILFLALVTNTTLCGPTRKRDADVINVFVWIGDRVYCSRCVVSRRKPLWKSRSRRFQYIEIGRVALLHSFRSPHPQKKKVIFAPLAAR